MKGGALVLAAGFSRRFGSDKRLFEVQGEPLLRRTVGAVQAAGLACRICLRPDDGVIPLAIGLPGLEFIECRDAAGGMGATLAEGVRACDDWDGLLVVLGDMAWVQPATLVTLWDALTPDNIVQPVFVGDTGNPMAGNPVAGNPVGFGSAYFGELGALEGDRGGRALLQRHRDRLLVLPVDDPGVVRDLDQMPEQA